MGFQSTKRYTQLYLLPLVLLAGDLALLVDTSHPMIRPDLEKGLDTARKIMQTGHGFCLQVALVVYFQNVLMFVFYCLASFTECAV